MRFFSVVFLVFLMLTGCKNKTTVATSVPADELQSVPASVITGTISYLENTKTPTPFWAEVELCELKADGRAGTTIAKMMVESPRQMPVEYRLIVDPKKIHPMKKYGLIARIFVDFDRLLWENPIPKPALTKKGSGNNIDIIVSRVSRGAK